MMLTVDPHEAPEYTTTSVGPPDYLKSQPAPEHRRVPRAQGMTEAAEHVAQASGCLLATVAAE